MQNSFEKLTNTLNIRYSGYWLFLIAFCIYLTLGGLAYANGDTYSVGKAAASLKTIFPSMTKAVTAIGYAGGVGLAVVGLFKLKAARDNPNTEKMSTAVVCILSATGMVWYPSFMGSFGTTTFGSEQQSAGSDSGGNPWATD
jgi:hypothetical protein